MVVGDLHGTLPFFKGNIESMADARKRHLKPGGRMIPARDVLHVAPAHAPHEYRKVESPWCGNAYGIDLSTALPFVVNHWWRADGAPIPTDRLLGTPRCWGVVDYGLSEASIHHQQPARRQYGGLHILRGVKRGMQRPRGKCKRTCMIDPGPIGAAMNHATGDAPHQFARHGRTIESQDAGNRRHQRGAPSV